MRFGGRAYGETPYASAPATGGPKLAAATFLGKGVLSAVAVKLLIASAGLTGVGTLTATSPVKIKQASAALVGRGVLSATGSVIHAGAASFLGRGTITASAVVLTTAKSATAAFHGAGLLAAVPVKIVTLGVAITGPGDGPPGSLRFQTTVVVNGARITVQDRGWGGGA